MKTGRNEPCPCGSGKKFKNCHADETPQKVSSSRMGWIVVAVVAAGAISLFASLRGGNDEPRPKGREMAPPGSVPVSQVPSTPVEPPPGDPPPGKVWSKEHGHWHDKADSSQIQLSTSSIPIPGGNIGTAPSAGSAPAATPGSPQPPGPAPEGKVWSVEHGHWHDAPGATTNADSPVPAELQPYMQPPGVPAAPAGAVWSEEHQHWHSAEEEAKRKGAVDPSVETTTQAQPPGNQR